MNNQQRAANIRWFGMPNPTIIEKQQIKAARTRYAIRNNIDQRAINLSNNVVLNGVRAIRAQLYPPAINLPINLPIRVIQQEPFAIELFRRRAQMLPPPLPKDKPLVQTRIDKLIEFKKQQKEAERRYNAPKAILRKTDPWKGFNRSIYTIQNINSMDGFYQMYKQIVGKQQNVHAIIRIINPDPEIPDIYRWINPEELESSESFLKYIDTLSKGEAIGGSDPLSDGSIIDPTYLSTVNFEITGFGGDPDTIIAKKTLPKKDIKALCLWNSIFSQIDEIPNYEIDKNITDAEEMEQHLIANYGKGLKIYSDALTYKPSKELKYSKIDINGKVMRVSEIDNSGLAVFKNPSPEALEYIEIVYYCDHYIPYEGVKKGKYYFDSKLQIIRVYDDAQNKLRVKTIKRQEVQKHTNIKQETITEVVTFDIETRYDENHHCLLKPYSISWTYKDLVYFYFGDDCVKVFLNFLTDRQGNTKFCLLGYNSSRFDNIFLIPELLEMDLLNNVFYQSSSILNIKWGRRHTVHDICRFANCSLKTACEQFQTKYRKIGDFNHNDVQRHFNNTNDVSGYFHDVGCEHKQTGIICVNIDTGDKINKTAEVLTNDIISKCSCNCDRYNKLVVYNMFDVLSTHEIYTKIQSVCRSTKVIEGNLFDYKTIGSTIYKKFINDIKDNNARTKKGDMYKEYINLPSLDFDQYNQTRAGLFAGRTQCYKGVQYQLFNGVNKYRMLDVKSLYPYVALNRWYPCGDIEIIDYSECMERNLIGFYNCRINQETMKVKVIPLRSKNNPLDWNYGGDIIAFINTVDIKCILDYGGKVEILKRKNEIEDDGYAFSNKIHGTDLFQCLDTFKRLKGDQDLVKALLKFKDQIIKDNNYECVKVNKELAYLSRERIDELVAIEYNPALRNMAKLFLNSLTGKVIENLHLDASELIKSDKDLEKVKKRCDNVGSIKPSAILNKAVGIISYKKRVEDVFKKDNRPIYLGCLIYAYARDHMYREILHDYDVIYQDTDSALISLEEYNRFKTNKPNSLGGEFGEFELEPGSEYYDSYVTLAPKNYFIYGYGPAPEIKSEDDKIHRRRLYKKGFKGVNLTQDKYIHDIESPDLSKYVHRTVHINGAVTYYIQNAFELYNDRSDLVKTVYDDCPRFIDNMREKEYAYILTSSLVKSMKTTESGFQSGGIYARFMLKKIDLRTEQKIKQERLANRERFSAEIEYTKSLYL